MTPAESIFFAIGIFVSTCWVSVVIWMTVYGIGESMKRRADRRAELRRWYG